MTKVSVIVLTWNGKEDTLECVKSLGELTIRNFQLSIIVVDNNSSDGTQKAVRKLFKKISNPPKLVCKLIENKANLGFAEGNNVGMEYALDSGADFVLVLNNDTKVDKNLITEFLKASKKYPRAGVLSPKIYFAQGYEFHGDRYKKSDSGKVIWYAGGKIDWENVYGINLGVDEIDKGQFKKEKEIDFATGTCMFLRAKALNEVGKFDEKYFMYLEDADLSIRMKKQGWEVIYVPKAIVRHKVAQSSRIGSDLNDYFIHKNRLLFGFRNASLRTRFALFRESIRFLLGGRKWQKIGIRDFYLARFGKGSWK